MRHKQISLPPWQKCTHTGRFLSCWRVVSVGCCLPAETRDGQMTASASLFQFGIRQVRLNCLWFKLICFDSPLEQISSPSWEAATTSTAFHVTADRLACPCAPTPMAATKSKSSDRAGILVVSVGSNSGWKPWHRPRLKWMVDKKDRRVEQQREGCQEGDVSL